MIYHDVVLERLKSAGCVYRKPGRGDHEMWWSPLSNRFFTVSVEIHSRLTADETLKQAGLHALSPAQMLQE